MPPARDELWENGYDEAVEVNQRALIDKVLARYSGEFTVFRELLQNSDDAGAQAVEIHFKTRAFLERTPADGAEPSPSPDAQGQDQKELLDRKAALVHQWTFKNNGMVFRDEDWNRLKKIAEGNPDEEKIGAFGVGFYSLFSVTEEPFVTSGGQWMRFYWKDNKDQLFVRRGKIETDAWTTFEMALREPAPIPRAFDLTRFLASSITFMAHLCEISVFLDDKRISHLTKSPGVPKSVGLPKGLKASSPKGIMQVSDVKTKPLYIRAELMRWVYMAGSAKPAPVKADAKPATSGTSGGFFSSLFSSLAGNHTPQRTPTPAPPPVVEQVDPTAVSEVSVALSIFTAEIGVKLDQKLRMELNRATKKNPPTKMQLQLIYTGKDEYDASKKEDEKQPEMTGSVFQGLRADIEGTGAARIFIGHATGQTTGLAGHIAARFIPTVERESIDLMDRTVAVWNEELLYVGGFLARSAYEVEMENIRQLWIAGAQSNGKAERPDGELVIWLRGRALHALKFFTYRQSTPSSLVSSKMEIAFFACGDKKFSIISTAGIRDAADVRVPNPQFSEFLRNLPVLPEDVMSGASSVVAALRVRGLIREIEFLDVLQELRARPLSEPEMVACFKWWLIAGNHGEPRAITQIRTELLNAAALSKQVEGPDGRTSEEVIPMSSIQTFLNHRGMGAIIPTDAPLPPHLLPISISKQFDPQQLGAAFPWRELSILDWLQFVTDPAKSGLDAEHDLTKSPQWAERVLSVLARAWQSMSKGTQDEVAALFRGKSCIPSSAGMQPPESAYFQSAHVFRDLPIVTLPSGSNVKGALEKVLQAIGVRKHVDLQIVFSRMIKTGDWTIAELIKYLVAVQSTLTPLEMDRLKMTNAFPKEGESKVKDGKVVRCKASDLYEPLDVFRELGLPLLAWGAQPKWRSNSDEARFLFGLGLRRHPPLPVIIGLATSPDEKIRTRALDYFLEKSTTLYTDYDPAAFADLAFVPAVKGDKKYLEKPSALFANANWVILGFAVVDPALKADAVSKLKIREDPPASMLVSLLEKTPPSSEAIARGWFSLLATKIVVFSSAQLRNLSQLPIVPVKQTDEKTTRMLPPSQCYFAGNSNAQFHSKLFVFVDFGIQANQFLSACGTKHEPSVEEIAKILLDNPRKFYELADGRENYLIELRNIAVNWRLISSGTTSRMRKAPILLGSRRVKKEKPAVKDSPLDVQADLDEENWDYEYDLLPADQVVVVDDTNSYQLFGNSIFTAPQEDLLEAFYSQLGSKLLSALVREVYRTGGEIKGSRKAVDIRSLILERLPLFLHEHTHARAKISYNWLNNEKNFVVRTFGQLTVVKSLQLGNIRPMKSQDASAVARREGNGPVELWLSGNDKVDMYEVSTSMCRLFFEAYKVNDALLFMTILSTDLRALRRRGYNVDRILRQQQAEREAKEQLAREKEKSTALVSQGHAEPPLPPPKALPSPPGPSESSPGSSSATLDTAADAITRMPLSQHTIRQSLQSFDKWVRKFNPSASNIEESDADSPNLNLSRASPPPYPDGPPSRPTSPGQSRLSVGDSLNRRLTPVPNGNSRSEATPWNNIASIAQNAISACKPENNQELVGRENVKEVQNDGYCDVSGEDVKLVCIGDMGGVKVFVSRDVRNPNAILSTRASSIARFIYVIKPLCEVFQLPTSSVHIYYDLAGPRIAFNRNSSLFLNLRYYESWNDAAVQKGNMSDAYISWYMTLCHEIAHNVVRPHNSEHEFYFSAICQVCLPGLVVLLSTSQTVGSC